MSFTLFRHCQQQHKLLESIRDRFHATPLAIPDSTTQPLKIVAHRGRKAKIVGSLRELLENPSDIKEDLPFEEGILADTNFDRSIGLNAELGFKLLEGFLKGFGVSPPNVDGKINNNNILHFSFQEIKTVALEPLQVGTLLNKKRLNLDHAGMRYFLKKRNSRPYEMLLINKVFQSNRIAIELEKEKDQNMDVEIDILDKIFADAKAKINTKRNTNSAISFEGDTYLTFAFSCVELHIDEDTGFIGLGEWVNPDTPKSFGGRGMVRNNKSAKQEEEIVIQEKSLLHPSMAAILEWDEDL